MVANPEKEEPAHLARKGTMGRRRRRWRESVIAWWAGFAVLAGVAGWQGSWRIALLGLALWCLYEFALVPTICRIMTRQGFACREPVRGRLFACTRAHQQVKNDALWRLVGLRNPFRGQPEPDPNRETGQVVYSPSVRGRLAPADRAVILLAAASTVLTIAGMVYGFSDA